MQWIRENLFLTCLTGALLVCIVGAYFIRSGQDAAFENDDMGPRAETAFTIQSLSRSKAVNKAGILKAKKRLAEIKSQRDRVVRDATRWNKRYYSVLQLKLTDGLKSTPAFPYDAAAYQTHGLTLKFTNGYRKALYRSLGGLDITTWPIDTEISELSVKLEKEILARRKAAMKRVKFAQDRNPAPPADDDAEPVEPKKPAGVSDDDWYLSRLSEPDVSAAARKSATEELMLKKANAGSLFVSPSTLKMVKDPKLPESEQGPEELDVIFPKEIWQSTDAPAPRLWAAQLNLWVTRDILAVIDATNDKSLKSRGTDRTVPNAAIKYLRKIAIEETYLMQAGEANTNSALTQRATCGEYEIIEYNFSIVMNTKYLPVLMQKLSARGDHTVTKVTIEQLPPSGDGNRYYGTRPVSNVTIGGEVLFRSNWTRELIPAEIRDTLPDAPKKEAPKRR
jgi:hypothetical protein